MTSIGSSCSLSLPKVGSMSDGFAEFFPTACVTRHQLPPTDSLNVEAIAPIVMLSRSSGKVFDASAGDQRHQGKGASASPFGCDPEEDEDGIPRYSMPEGVSWYLWVVALHSSAR